MVMEDSPVLCLLRMDLLEQLKGVAMDFRTGNLLEIDSGKIVHRANEVFLTQSVTIPPRSEAVYYASTSNQIEGDWLFEPNQSFSGKYNIPICYGVVHADNHSVPVRLVNFDGKPITLKHNTKVGTITPVNQVNEQYLTKVSARDMTK